MSRQRAGRGASWSGMRALGRRRESRAGWQNSVSQHHGLRRAEEGARALGRHAPGCAAPPPRRRGCSRCTARSCRWRWSWQSRRREPAGGTPGPPRRGPGQSSRCTAGPPQPCPPGSGCGRCSGRARARLQGGRRGARTTFSSAVRPVEGKPGSTLGTQTGAACQASNRRCQGGNQA